MQLLANPLQYPLAMAVGGLLLVIGARGLNVTPPILVPVAIASSVGAATVLKQRDPNAIQLENPQLARELLDIRQSALELAEKAEGLQAESRHQLGDDTFHVELLAAVELACVRVAELPAKVDRLGQRLQGKDSLLSVDELQTQLQAIEQRKDRSTGVAREQLDRLATTITNNIRLARQGSDARQAQAIALSTMIQESAGMLQQLQNRLRTANLNDTSQVDELRSLSHDLEGVQENVDLLMAG
ncbi:MAG: hypothetical protein AAF974_03905 [Cyanobacteria bacterium P01_E01_bin.34]